MTLCWRQLYHCGIYHVKESYEPGHLETACGAENVENWDPPEQFFLTAEDASLPLWRAEFFKGATVCHKCYHHPKAALMLLSEMNT